MKNIKNTIFIIAVLLIVEITMLSTTTNLKSKTMEDVYYGPRIIQNSIPSSQLHHYDKDIADQQDISWLLGKIGGRDVSVSLPFYSYENNYKKLSCTKLPQLNKVKQISASSNNDLLAVTGDHKVHILVNNEWKEVTKVNEKYLVETADIWSKDIIFFTEVGTGAGIYAGKIWDKISFWVADFGSHRSINFSTYKVDEFLVISEKTSRVSNGKKGYYDGTTDGYATSFSSWTKRNDRIPFANNGCMNENGTYLLDSHKRLFFDKDDNNRSLVAIVWGSYSYLKDSVIKYRNHVGQDNVKCSPRRFAVQDQKNKIMFQSKKNPQTLISPYFYARLWDLGDDNTVFVQGERQETSIKRCTIPDI